MSKQYLCHIFHIIVQIETAYFNTKILRNWDNILMLKDHNLFFALFFAHQLYIFKHHIVTRYNRWVTNMNRMMTKPHMVVLYPSTLYFLSFTLPPETKDGLQIWSEWWQTLTWLLVLKDKDVCHKLPQKR